MKKAIFGNGGHSKEIRSYFDFEVVVFVDDNFLTEDTLPISSFDPTEYEIMVAISDSELRKKIVETLPTNTKYFTFIHQSSLISGNVKISEGAFIGPNCILTSNITIGSHCLLNRGNQIGHDCVIGNFFSAMPGSVVSGNNFIGDCVYLGANSTTKEKIQITSNCKFGLNSGVIKNVFVSGVYVGTPAKRIIKK